MAAFYTFEDLSGVQLSKRSDNPYEDLINDCHNDPSQIQDRYNVHRTKRNAQQRAKLLSPEFTGVVPDEILAKLEDASIDPGFTDWRNCLVFWARPPQSVQNLVSQIQKKLLEVVPSLWTMAPSNLHMTTLEITHSLTTEEIDSLVEQMLPYVPDIADHPATHRARLVKPILSFDAQAFALSYLPATGEVGRSAEQDSYTYHHLRRDVFAKASATGVKVASRYVIPSAHLTIGRFINKRDFERPEGTVDHEQISKLIEKVEEINSWLEAKYWPRDDAIESGGEWIVGEDKGLEFRKGALWYGGAGQTVYLGRVSDEV